MDALDRKELDRLYARLLDRFAGPARPRPQVDTLSLAELEKLLLESVRDKQSAPRDLNARGLEAP